MEGPSCVVTIDARVVAEASRGGANAFRVVTKVAWVMTNDARVFADALRAGANGPRAGEDDSWVVTMDVRVLTNDPSVLAGATRG